MQRETSDLYSSYSEHFRTLDPALYEQNKQRLETNLEQLRLQLDLALIDRYVQGPMILDFPIGTGRIYPHLLERFTLYGYDICEPYIDQARSLYPHLAERFQVCSLEAPIQERAFDSILTFRVLDQVKDLEQVMRGVHDLLKPGGRWLISLHVPVEEQGAFRTHAEAANLRVSACHAYDFHAGHRRLGPFGSRLAGYWRALIARGLVPRWLYAGVDRVFRRYGTHFLVLERPSE